MTDVTIFTALAAFLVGWFLGRKNDHEQIIKTLHYGQKEGYQAGVAFVVSNMQKQEIPDEEMPDDDQTTSYNVGF